MTTDSLPTTATDFLALVKPRVTALVIATTAAGMFLAGRPLSPPLLLWTLLGTVLLVGAANALNMYLERDADLLMERTKDRPLPAKRMAPPVALWFGIELAFVALVILSVGVNPLTAFLGVVAFVSYVLFYTPLKQKTTLALLVGAVPGAMPPLMGWTAATGKISLPGILLFLILFLWQIPHFLSISLFRKGEYAKAGIKVLPLEKGELVAKHWMVRSLAALFPVPLFFIPLGLTSRVYEVTAILSNLIFFAWGCYGFRKRGESPHSDLGWARSFFFVSIIYLPVLLFILVWTKGPLGR